jgi:hypothetical protein
MVKYGLKITNLDFSFLYTQKSHVIEKGRFAREGLQNLSLCSAFEQGGIFIVPHLL